MNTKDIIDEIDKQRGYLKILMHLLKHEKANVRQISGHTDVSHGATYNALSKLIEDGLVVEKEEWGPTRKGGKRKNYYLTDKGREVAKKLTEIQDIVNEDYKGSSDTPE